MPVASATARLETVDPATLATIGSVPIDGADAVRDAVVVARVAARAWARVPVAERGALVARVAGVLLERRDEIAALITRENGKPLTEALAAEVLGSLDLLGWLAGNAPRVLADEPVPMRRVHLMSKRGRIQYRPLGVIGVIAPSNYPLIIALAHTAQAVVAGNGVVLKPAEETPLVGAVVQELFEAAGAPRGLVRVVQGRGETGAAVVEHVDKVFFTGSTAVGRLVGEACARRLIGAVLELGGKDAMLVFADADLDRAVDGALWAAFMNAGQMCVSVERILVEASIAETFATRLAEGARALSVGDGRSPGTDIGPITTEEQFEHIGALVEDAIGRGARLLTGGRPVAVPGRAGRFYAPTVLTDVPATARLRREPACGRGVTIAPFPAAPVAIARANDSDHGLGASVWTRDRDRAARVARELRAGQVWSNDHTYSFAAGQAPWGGTGESGLGRSGSHHGLHGCTQITFVDADRGRLRQPWWLPYDERAPERFRTLADVLHGPSLRRRAGAAVRGRRDLIGLARSYFRP
jgi:succinate-semialdehyde dehydrogenase/glutarate-semialdehyde dehydrogenase